jgi:hypothetical protein
MPLIKATDKVIDLANGSIDLGKLIQTPSDVFSLTFGHDSVDVTNNGTQRFGSVVTDRPSNATADTSRQTICPLAGTLIAANIIFSRGATGGTATNHTITLNNQTSSVLTVLSSTIDYANNASFNAVYTSFSPAVTVAVNDILSMNWIVPNLATYPVNVRNVIVLWFKRILA